MSEQKSKVVLTGSDNAPRSFMQGNQARRTGTKDSRKDRH